MPRFEPYKKINQLIENESFEPTFTWGLRMAVAAIVPVIWGVATDNMLLASWITLPAELICWVELKGSFGQRVRILLGGILLTLIFALLGSITGNILWLSLVMMLFVGFLSGLFKNLGDRGSSLAVCVYVVFILTNAYPVKDFDELQARLLLFTIGGVWNLIVGIAFSIFIPARVPYRRTIAIIWKANASLLETVAKGWDGSTLRSSIRNIYLKEREVRTALDGSFQFYEKMAHQTSKKTDEKEHQLAQLRKATALIASNIMAISDELENLKIKDVPEDLRLKLHGTVRALQQAMERMAVYVISLRPEDQLLLNSRLTKAIRQLAILKEASSPEQNAGREPLRRTRQLIDRTIKLTESARNRLEEMGDDLPVFRSYSLVKTLLILHPRHWFRNIRLLLNFNTFTARYALRAALASTIGLLIYKWLHIDHGYWIPFTAMIVVQPYFGATFRKAVDRVIGTIAGGLVGGLLIRLPAGLYAKEIMLFFCFIFMVYFIRKRYSIAAFFITLSVVLLFDVEETLNPMLIATRALSTIGGAALGILAGFAFLPHWDKKWLPIHLSNAICCNYQYFKHTFFPPSADGNWTKLKRSAESKNSNAFDSFNRYMNEPAIGKRPYIPFYQLITHNVRITRELNNIHLEQEIRQENTAGFATPEQQEKINECLYWFNRNMEALRQLHQDVTTDLVREQPSYIAPVRLSLHQQLYIDKLLAELKAMHQDLHHLLDQPTK